MSDLKNEFYKDLAKVKDMLYTQVVSKDKFFPKNPENVRNYHLVGGARDHRSRRASLRFILGAGIGAAIFGVPIALVGLLVAR